MTDLRPASFIPLRCSLEDIAIRIEPGEPPAPTGQMLDRWARAAASNPKLFNGPILRYLSHDTDGERGVRVRARHDTYQRYATQRHDPADADPERDVFHLAVTGVVVVRGEDGSEAVALGRRGAATFVYPEMWEHAPGGGLESADIRDQLLREMEEELGLPGLVDGSRRGELLEPPEADEVLGLTIDPNTPSVDVIVRVRLRGGAERAMGARSWEYGSTRFVPVAALDDFLDCEGEAGIIPPTLAIWRGMGWIESGR